MTDGLVLLPGSGHRIASAGMTLKVGAEQSTRWSAFEADVPPGFDVGAHRHGEAEELFYILGGELDLLAFEPRIRTAGDWQRWESTSGDKVARGGTGSLMYVPGRLPARIRQPRSGTGSDALPRHARRPRAVPARARRTAGRWWATRPGRDRRAAGPPRHRAAHPLIPAGLAPPAHSTGGTA